MCKFNVSALLSAVLAATVPADMAAAAEPESGGAASPQAAAWKQTVPGDYKWTDAANWSGAIPNGKGAVADLNIGLQGRMTVSFDQPITLGTLKIGEAAGTAGAASVGLAGDQPLTFEAAKPGDATLLSITQGKVPGGTRLDLAAGLRLGGSSPLTLAIASPAAFDCIVHSMDLNGNTFTLQGPRRYNPSDGWRGVSVQIGSLSGSGNYIQDGAGTYLPNDCPDFTGTMTVNNGDCGVGRLPAVSQYVVAGAFIEKNKYPRGGVLTVRGGKSDSPSAPVAPRLNPKATLVFAGGGQFVYSGHAFDEMGYLGARRPAYIEPVRQIVFLSGMSEINVMNGNDVASSTTLMATDPEKALVRNQGATVMLGGGDVTSKQGYWGSYGMTQKLVFVSGVSGYLKGAGGAPGTKNRSILPWATMGTLYHPGDGGWATYDEGKGVHTLRKEEYDYVLAGSPDRNVRCDQLNLGTNKTQTVNSLIVAAYGNADIGPGSTLTITSGALKTGSMGGYSIGATPGAAGTINFGPAEGIIWTAWVTPYGDTTIHSTLAGSGGLTKAATSTLILTAANTYTGKTCVAAGTLQVGDGKTTASKLGAGDVEVANGATLSIKSKVASAILDTATVTLCHAGTAFYGTVNLDSGVNETVGGLLIDGKLQPAGTYGSKESAATHKLENYFTGSGILTVTGKAAQAKP